MHWLYLALAICFEVAGTICMKMSAGFTKLWPSLGLFAFYTLCFSCLTLALKKMDLSLAYAIWAGLGTTLITLAGVIFFKEPVSALKIGSVILIIVGVIGLQLGGGH